MNRRTLSQNTLLIALALLVAVALTSGCAPQTSTREAQVGDVVQVEKEDLFEQGAARPQPMPAPAQPVETKGGW